MRTSRLLPLVLAASFIAAGCAKDRDEHEERIALDQVPAAVRATLTAEARGAAIGDVEREEEHGRTQYEAKARIDGKRYEFKVAADGKLLSKKLDDDDKEDEGEHRPAATRPH